MKSSSSNAGSSPTVPGTGDSLNDFIVITTPLPSIENFLDWVTEQRLPNAKTVLNHHVDIKHRDEIVMHMDRHQYIEDMLKSFAPRREEGKKMVPQKAGDVPRQPSPRGRNTTSRAVVEGEEASPWSTDSGNSNGTTLSSSTGSASTGGSEGKGGGGANIHSMKFKSSEIAVAENSRKQLSRSTSPATFNPPPSTNKEPIVPDSHWERVLEQFKRDLPRERFYIEGERINDVDVFFKRMYKFVEELPRFLRRQAIAITSPIPPPAASPCASGPSSFLWGMVNFVASPLFTSGSNANQSNINAFAAGASSHHLPPSPDAGGYLSDGRSPRPGALPSPGAVPTQSEIEDATEQLIRLVVLMSQQSVLALPFEVLHNQYMAESDADIFLGEPKAGDRVAPSSTRRRSSTTTPQADAFDGDRSQTPQGGNFFHSPIAEDPADTNDPLGTAMSVHLRVKGNGEACVIEIRKVFRVFTLLDGSDDTTLFLVAAKMTMNVLDTKDPVELAWSVRTPLREGPRLCDCLGASSGYHQLTCQFHASNSSVVNSLGSTPMQ